ncbi:MAG TPA: hypothetical protein VKB61_04440 [Candidatus Acidoferrum sp.]|nr:hypothetical protein [Candidatus Acidoferrum sp.]
MSRASIVAAAIVVALIAFPACRAQSPAEQDLYARDVPRPFPLPCSKAATGDPFRSPCPISSLLAQSNVLEISSDSSEPLVRIPLALSEGTALRVLIDQRTRLSRVGEPVEGHIVETVYAFDEPVIPAGSVVSGRVSRIERVSLARRISSYANGNFSPFRRYTVTFDRVTLPDGRELAIHTTVAPGSAEVVHLVSKTKDAKEGEHKSLAGRAADSAKHEVKDRLHEANSAAHQAADEIRTPGRMERLKQFLAGQVPYRRQFVTVGTRFSASLDQPLYFGAALRTQQQMAAIGSRPPADVLLHARLMLEVSSATATRGNPVIAELTEPIYSDDHRLVLPAQSRLIGQVVEAKHARHLHRNGELRVIFEHLEVPGGDLQRVQGSLEGIEVDRSAHLKLDEEGGAHATDSKMRYLSTGVALLMAAVAAHPDAERGTADQAGDPAVRAGAGASGFGLAGTLIGLASKSNAVSIIFSAYGASASIYSNFLSRGRDVVLPKNVPMEIGLGAPHAGPKQRQR